MRSICYAKATYYGIVFPPNFGGVTIFLFAALAPWPVFLQKAVNGDSIISRFWWSIAIMYSLNYSTSRIN